MAHVAVDTEIIRYVHEVDSRKRTKGESLPWEIVKQSMKNSDIDSGLMALEIEGTMQTLRVSSENCPEKRCRGLSVTRHRIIKLMFFFKPGENGAGHGHSIKGVKACVLPGKPIIKNTMQHNN